LLNGVHLPKSATHRVPGTHSSLFDKKRLIEESQAAKGNSPTLFSPTGALGGSPMKKENSASVIHSGLGNGDFDLDPFNGISPTKRLSLVDEYISGGNSSSMKQFPTGVGGQLGGKMGKGTYDPETMGLNSQNLSLARQGSDGMLSGIQKHQRSKNSMNSDFRILTKVESSLNLLIKTGGLRMMTVVAVIRILQSEAKRGKRSSPWQQIDVEILV